MTDALKIGKRAFTAAVAAATIFWSIGVSAFLQPLTAQAVAVGSLIKGPTLTTVYYYASNGNRYAFPNEKTYFSWYTDFSGVSTITDSELAAIPLAGNIVYRPGSHWIKIQSDPKTYAVSPQGQIHWIESEAVASAMAGSDWNAFIDDVPDTFFVDYTVGTSIMDGSDAYNGALVLMGGSDYLVWNGQKRLITSGGWTGNRFQTRFLLDGSGIDLAGLSTGSDVTGAESTLTDTAQLGTTVTGGLSVSIASDTPASATVPAGASSVPFTKVKLTANSGSATVSQMVFKLGGVGDVGNIDNVYLYEGDNRITDARSVNSSTREVTFSALNIDLSTAESDYVTVRADISDAPNGGDTASFYLADASSITSTATVSGSFPILGNTMTFSETAAGTIIVDKNGTISDPTLGEKDATIAKFSLQADGEDASVESITLNVDKGSDHSNYKLWEGSTLLATGTQGSDSDLVTFSLTNPLDIQDGDSDNLTMSADVDGDAGDTIGVAVEDEADVTAIGGDFGFNMAVDISGYDDTGSSCNDSGDLCSFSTIIGGQLTFAFNGPASDDIQIDGQDQDIMDFTLTAENWTEVKKIFVLIECSDAGTACDGTADDDDLINDGTGDANFQDITIRKEDGTTWMGPEELDTAGDDTSQELEYTDTQDMQAGDSLDLMITTDVDSAAVAGNAVRATIETNQTDAEDINGDSLDPDTDIVPSADIVGNDFTLTNSSLDVSLSSPPSSGTFVKGATNVDVVGFSFQAGNASDITITEAVFSAQGGDDDSTDATLDVGDHVSSCSMYDSESGSLVDGPESPDTADQMHFDSFSWDIAAGETNKALLRCNFSNTDVESGDGDDVYSFFFDSEDDITAEDADGDNVDADFNGSNENSDGVTEITIINSGTLNVTLDGSTPSSTIILGSSTGITVGMWKFDAADEPFTVETVTLNNLGFDDVAANVKLSCSDSSGATVSKTGFLSSGQVVFQNLTCYVPTDVTKTFTATVDTNSVSSTGAASGDDLQLELSADGDDFKAVGASSGETLDETDVGVALTVCDPDNFCDANDMVIRKTKPTISLASGSPSGAGVPGLSEVFRFNVAADSRGFVDLNAVTFKLTSTDGSGSDWNTCGSIDDATKWEMYDLDDSSTKLDDDNDWVFLDSGDDTCNALSDVKYAILDMQNDLATPVEEIGAGDTNTYVVRVDTTGASSSDDDSIRLDIPDESDVNNDGADCAGACDSYDNMDLTNDSGNEIAAISWNDDVEATEVSGQYIKNLPVTGGTIVY